MGIKIVSMSMDNMDRILIRGIFMDMWMRISILIFIMMEMWVWDINNSMEIRWVMDIKVKNGMEI